MPSTFLPKGPSNLNYNRFQGQSNGKRFKGQSLIKSWLSLLGVGNIYCLSCSMTVSFDIKTFHLAEKLLKRVDKQLKTSFRNSVKPLIYTRSHSAKVNCKSWELDSLKGKTNWASKKTLRGEKLQRPWDPAFVSTTMLEWAVVFTHFCSWKLPFTHILVSNHSYILL